MGKLQDIREAFGEAFEKIGGITALAEWAKKNPDKFYSHYAKLATKQVKATLEDKTHEGFVKFMHELEEKKRKKLGQPDQIIDVKELASLPNRDRITQN